MKLQKGDRIEIVSMQIESHEEDINPNEFIGERGTVKHSIEYSEDDPYNVCVELDNKELEKRTLVGYWREKDLLLIK